MHQLGQEAPGDADETADLQAHEPGLAALRLLRPVEPGRGVEQGQAAHPLGRPAQDLEGDIAAHGKRGQGEIALHRGERPLGHGGDRRILRQVGDTGIGDIGQRRGLTPPQPLVTEQPGQEKKGNTAHGGSGELERVMGIEPTTLSLGS